MNHGNQISVPPPPAEVKEEKPFDEIVPIAEVTAGPEISAPPSQQEVSEKDTSTATDELVIWYDEYLNGIQCKKRPAVGTTEGTHAEFPLNKISSLKVITSDYIVVGILINDKIFGSKLGCHGEQLIPDKYLLLDVYSYATECEGKGKRIREVWASTAKTLNHVSRLRPRIGIQLSVHLLKTYKKINEAYYEGQRKKNSQKQSKELFNDGYDDQDGNYIVTKGEELLERYVVQDVLGKGSFGIVVNAHDHRRDERVAVKIIRNRSQFHSQAKVEIDILMHLGDQSGDDFNIVKLRKVFHWKGHVCIVFELLSLNLYELLRCTKFNGISLNLVRKFANQIFTTLDFLCSKEVNIIHCDLKPENILLRNSRRSLIKIIDFGSSCYAHRPLYRSYIQSRFYRSPEVILGRPYDCAIDMWSAACILVEMHVGNPLFDGKTEAQQLEKFQAILGTMPNGMREGASKWDKFFTDGGEGHTLKSVTAENPVVESSLCKVIEKTKGRRKDQDGHSEEEYRLFLDLITSILKYNPKERITPAQALKHPFIKDMKQEEKSEDPLNPAQTVKADKPKPSEAPKPSSVDERMKPCAERPQGKKEDIQPLKKVANQEPPNSGATAQSQ